MAKIDISEEMLAPLENSLCVKCENRMTIVMVPIDMESFGMDEDVRECMGIEDGESIELGQHTCLVTNEDIDFIALKCSHFKNKIVFMKTEPY